MRPHSIAEALKKNSILHACRTAVVCRTTGLRLTHREFYRRALRLAAVLRQHGVARGDRVGVTGANSVLHVEAYAGAALGGYVVVPINPMLSRSAVEEITAETRIKVVIGIYADITERQFSGAAQPPSPEAAPPQDTTPAAKIQTGPPSAMHSSAGGGGGSVPLPHSPTSRPPSVLIRSLSEYAAVMGGVAGAAEGSPIAAAAVAAEARGGCAAGDAAVGDAAYAAYDTEVWAGAGPPGIEDDWVILFTSGTSSGRQKGVVRNQSGTINGILSHSGPMRLDERTVGLVAFPVHSISSFFFAFLYLYVGGAMVVADVLTKHIPTAVATATAALGHVVAPAAAPLPPSVPSLVREEGVTFVTLSPLLLQKSFLAGSDGAEPPAAPTAEYATLRTILVTGAVAAGPFRLALRDWFSARGCSVDIFDVYGSTEAGVISVLPPEKLESAAGVDGCVGTEPPGVHLCRIRCQATGELVTEPGRAGCIEVCTTMMMKGYLSTDASLPAVGPDGYFRQGDVGCRMGDGTLCLLGRSDDVIVHQGGALLYPVEVESQVASIASATALQCGTFEIHAVGLPQNDHAEHLAVLIVLSDDGLSDADLREVEDSVWRAVSASWSAHVEPSFLRVVRAADPRLPKTANGKIRKTRIAAEFDFESHGTQPG